MDITANTIKLTWTELQAYMELYSVPKTDLMIMELSNTYIVKLQVAGWVLYTTIPVTTPPGSDQSDFEEFIGT